MNKFKGSNGDRIKIAIIGDRGIPARYSGFSTLVEQLAVRLVETYDFDVSVYCRSSYYREKPLQYKGVQCIYLPSPGGKSFESILHSNLSIIHAFFQPYDLVFVLDPGNGPFILPLKVRGLPVVMHTDGMGWKRSKWSDFQRKYYKWSEWVTSKLSTWLVTDSRAMQDYYQNEYMAESSFIPYSGVVAESIDESILGEYGLEKDGYFMCCARLEPENNVHVIIQEFKAARSDKILIVVGSARYDSPYANEILNQSSNKVLCLGGIWESTKLDALFANCFAYIHGHEVGGTNPSLLNAMHRSAAPVCIDVVFHREVMSDQGMYFNLEKGNLANLIEQLEDNPALISEQRDLANRRSNELYRWDAVADAYAQMFSQVIRKDDSKNYLHREFYQPSRFY